jgi:folylpolyglutamate synthase/dihydrofolate synthase
MVTATDPQARLRQAEREILARRPEHSIEPSLDRIAALTRLLGDPQRAYPVIHITGTNGKTSTARMTETLLRARGLRTGLFTSPHLSSIRERITVDGEPLSAERFADAYDEVLPYLAVVDQDQPAPLSFFEVLTAMAFAVFTDAPVDVAVIEVGVGGTWDCTNIADGTVAVITPISLDHERYLGNTVTSIAGEKAGIIKPGAVAVLAQQPVDAAEVLLRRAVEVGATVAREGLEFGVTRRELAVGGQLLGIHGLLGNYDDLFLPLFGAHQAGNAACALAAVEAFAGAPSTADYGELGAGGVQETGRREAAQPAPAATAGRRSAMKGEGEAGGVRAGGSGGVVPPRQAQLDPELVRTAFAMMSSPGRLEVVRRSPVVIVDAAHNPAGMAATVAALSEAFTFSELVAIIAVSEDKDVPGILDELEPVVSELVVTGNSSPRSADPAKLAEMAGAVFGPDRVRMVPRLDDAIEIGVALADEADARGTAVVLIAGSVITAGDARLLLTRSDPGGPGPGLVPAPGPADAARAGKG